MGRTLRGFEESFPYLGARGDGVDGDVQDPSLIDKEEAYGAIGDLVTDQMFGPRKLSRSPVLNQSATASMIQHRYGETTGPPPGFTIGPMGQLIKSTPVQLPQSPQTAAQAASLAAKQRGISATIPHKTVWDITGTSWQVGTTVPVNERTALDQAMQQIARQYNVHLFKTQARAEAGGMSAAYVFSLSPRAIPIGGRVAGYTVQALHQPT